MSHADNHNLSMHAECSARRSTSPFSFHRRKSPPMLLLTDLERELLIKTWRDDFDSLYELGCDIYEYIFTIIPNAMQLFPNVARHGEKWKDCKEFRTQALRFVQLLSSAVKNLYHPERMEPMLLKVGQTHVQYGSRGFKSEYWGHFQTSMEVSISKRITLMEELSEEEKVAAVKAWKLFAQYITLTIFKGFKEASKNSVNVEKPPKRADSVI